MAFRKNEAQHRMRMMKSEMRNVRRGHAEASAAPGHPRHRVTRRHLSNLGRSRRG